MEYVDLLFRNPPGVGSDFVEANNPEGKSVKVGEWFFKDGYWVLRIEKGTIENG